MREVDFPNPQSEYYGTVRHEAGHALAALLLFDGGPQVVSAKPLDM